VNSNLENAGILRIDQEAEVENAGILRIDQEVGIDLKGGIEERIDPKRGIEEGEGK
ncbi:9866_t:CDS:1, partial [Funneliformis geosporum]